MMTGKSSLGAGASRINGFDLKSFLGQEPGDELAELDVIIDYRTCSPVNFVCASMI